MATAHALVAAASFHAVAPREPRPPSTLRGGLMTRPPPPPPPPQQDQYEARLGRRLRPTPARLTGRILYVPRHDDTAAHLPLYDFRDAFAAAVRDDPIGSSRFKTSFGLMPKPAGDGRGGASKEVAYLLDFFGGRGVVVTTEEETKATVQRRMLGAGAQVGLTIPPEPPGSSSSQVEDGAVAFRLTPSSTTVDIPVTTSWPLAPTVSRLGATRHPWFTFTVPSLLDEERTFQWQIHPVAHGLLRYTLVELPPVRQMTTTTVASSSDEIPFSAAQEDNQGRIRAIYHNVGLGFCLSSQPHSEGAVLLQGDLGPELEALVVASLVGLLWRVRNETTTTTRPRGRKAGSVGESGDVPSQGGGKKKLFGKILGRKKVT